MREQRRRYENKRSRIIRIHTFTAVVAVVVLLLFMTVFLTGKQTKAGNLETSAASGKYYTSYEVKSGDTLWTIAEAYCAGSGQNIQAYVDEVCRINRLSDCNQIYSGNQICIPYYH